MVWVSYITGLDYDKEEIGWPIAISKTLGGNFVQFCLDTIDNNKEVFDQEHDINPKQFTEEWMELHYNSDPPADSRSQLLLMNRFYQTHGTCFRSYTLSLVEMDLFD
jgi:hypothetical protein